jgi:hypothetical protein
VFRYLVETIIFLLSFLYLVALIFLICNELIVEAKQAQGDNEKWYIGIQIFVGIYMVLMLDHVL